MSVVEFTITLLSSLAAIIALISRIYESIRKISAEKKYSELFGALANAMITAEEMSEMSGEEKKKKVIELSSEAADQLGIKEFNAERISYMIEQIIKITKRVNVKK